MKASVAEIINTLKAHEPVTVLINDDDKKEIERLCGLGVDLMSVAHTSGRIRDYGPMFLIDGKGGSAAVDWHFDGWNQSVPQWQDDHLASHTLLGQAEIRRFRAPLTLEGSAVCSDGVGTILVNSASALRPKRNPEVNKLDAYTVLRNWLGATRVIWIDEPRTSENPECDVRLFCTLTSPGTVAVGNCREGQWAATLDTLAARLSKVEDGRGQTLRVERLPFIERNGFPCPYTTFYVLNKSVIVPSYDAPEDERAVEIISNAFPGRSVEQFPALDLVVNGGHLSTFIQYQPARLLERSKATLLPRSAWQRPVPDYVGLLQEYIEKVEAED